MLYFSTRVLRPPINPLPDGAFFFFAIYLVGFFLYLGLKEFQIPGEEKKKNVRQRVDRGPQNTCAIFQDPTPKSSVNNWAFVRKTCQFVYDRFIVTT